MSFLDDFDEALDFDLIDPVDTEFTLLAIQGIVDTALNDIKHQRIVDTGKVTDWLLDIRQLVNNG